MIEGTGGIGKTPRLLAASPVAAGITVQLKPAAPAKSSPAHRKLNRLTIRKSNSRSRQRGVTIVAPSLDATTAAGHYDAGSERSANELRSSRTAAHDDQGPFSPPTTRAAAHITPLATGSERSNDYRKSAGTYYAYAAAGPTIPLPSWRYNGLTPRPAASGGGKSWWWSKNRQESDHSSGQTTART